MALSLDDGCPRCGSETVSTTSDKVACIDPDGKCGAVWMDFRSWERECIARDLTGTRKRKVGKEYLTAGAGEPESLQRDLHELVSLVALMSLQQVNENLTLAINGRRDIINHNLATAGLYEEKLDHEINALVKMQSWLEGVMKMYGGDDEEG
jgi:hypothetical protein